MGGKNEKQIQNKNLFDNLFNPHVHIGKFFILRNYPNKLRYK